MRVNYFAHYSIEPSRIMESSRFLSRPEYVGLKAGDIHIVILDDFDTNFESALSSLRIFIDDDSKIPREHECYEILKELIYSRDINNCIIALQIINKIE